LEIDGATLNKLALNPDDEMFAFDHEDQQCNVKSFRKILAIKCGLFTEKCKTNPTQAHGKHLFSLMKVYVLILKNFIQ